VFRAGTGAVETALLALGSSTALESRAAQTLEVKFFQWTGGHLRLGLFSKGKLVGWVSDTEPGVATDILTSIRASEMGEQLLFPFASTSQPIVTALVGIPQGNLSRGMGGSFGTLSRLGVVGDQLTPHHMPQVALGFTTPSAGGALALPNAEHILTRTYGFRGAVLAQEEAGLPFRTVLARDIRDLRSIVGPRYNAGLRSLLDYYRANFPTLMEKPPVSP
jgi:hypothetical protein